MINMIESRRGSKMRIHMRSKESMLSPKRPLEITDHGTPNMIPSYHVTQVHHANELNS